MMVRTRYGFLDVSALLFSLLLLLLLLVVMPGEAHFLITYPQPRGYLYHSQFQFPCGGVPPSTNRTVWPTNGGALSIIPIHPFALMTVNIALGNSSTINEIQDSNPYNVPMVALFNQTGANSTFCIPKVKIPKKLAGQVKAGVQATLQVIQLTATGAALYGCVDLTFSDTEADRFADPAVWNKYCFNGTGMSAKPLVAVNSTGSGSAAVRLVPTAKSVIAVGAVSLLAWLV